MHPVPVLFSSTFTIELKSTGGRGIMGKVKENDKVGGINVS